jgi:hypothetical protein
MRVKRRQTTGVLVEVLESPWDWWRLHSLEKMELCQTSLDRPSVAILQSFVSAPSEWWSKAPTTVSA